MESRECEDDTTFRIHETSSDSLGLRTLRQRARRNSPPTAFRIGGFMIPSQSSGIVNHVANVNSQAFKPATDPGITNVVGALREMTTGALDKDD